jgi:hypothetical protein
MRWRNAGMYPQGPFGLESWAFLPIPIYAITVTMAPIGMTLALIAWVGLIAVLNLRYGFRFMDLFTLVSRFVQGEWRFR